ncbi:endothelin-converting enzyme homolog [Paramacrobiotus metropolitanus]|uniref:endothelin-converting enzyme homolog n=1 Tax=Paramacrobiotus metropolitanus TaxID=2943436 RepID=UPI00244605CC|nr:endothelin-converting enzyme homolog [Paramacrobiotus metropolitanus]
MVHFTITLQFTLLVGVLALFWPGCISRCAFVSDKAAAKRSSLSQSSPADAKAAICRTPACKEIASKFLTRIDTSVNPCDDFYDYSCGKWIKAQKGEAGEFAKLNDKTRAVGKKLLRGDVKPAGPPFAAEKKMKDLYKQCINTAEIEKLRGVPMIKILNEFNGGWPMITPNWDASKFNVFDVLVNNHFFGIEPFFAVSIMADIEQPTVNRVVLDSMIPWTDTDLLLDPETEKSYTQQYLNGMTSATKLLLRDNKQQQDVAKLAPNITDIVQLELSLAKERLTAVELNNDTIFLNKFSLKTFKNHHKFKSAILRNITGYLQAYFAVANRSAAITDDTIVIVPTLRYWNKLDDKLVELEKQGEEGKRRMANYIGYKLIDSVLKYLSKDYQAINGEVASSVEDKCLDIIKNTMPLALGTLYVRDIVPRDLKKKATMMVNDIHAGFKELLDEAKWMDKATYDGAVKKLAAIEEIVGYPDIMLTNTSAIDSYFTTLTIQSTFLRSILQTQKNNLIRDLKAVTQPHLRYDPLKDTDDISAVNAYYSPRQNQLIILASILRIPFFEAEAPQYLNYGGIGYVIGHEVTHGFDDTGAKYDPEGVRRLWWTSTTIDEYKRRAKSIIDQYNAYTMPSGKVNGQLTSGENIADNGGLRAALKGYSRYLARPDTKETVPPGLENYTPMQLFFISAGQVWCYNSTPEKERMRLLTDEHAPSKWRVNGPMSNFPEFAQTFNCPLGSKMNPKIKNRVW